jgi:hypothetical protein
VAANARYADDFQIYVKTHHGVRCVFYSVERFLKRKLNLVLNRQKSCIAKTLGGHMGMTKKRLPNQGLVFLR